MCGISLIINKDFSKVDEALLTDYNELIKHRGPDGEGFYFNDNLGIAHRRLSIIELSELGAQPMTYNDSLVISFNGEIYNYIEIRNKLIAEGYDFKSNSDTEVILASYHKWGPDCVNKFSGMWAFVIFDKLERKIFASRDRFGIKPLYYYSDAKHFCIASEIKQIVKSGISEARANHNSVFDFILKSKLVYDENTFFENIFALNAGKNLIYDLKNNSFDLVSYYSIDQIKIDNDISFSEAEIKLKKLFYVSVNLHLVSDVPVVSCLSGGIDSSSIVSVARNISNKALAATISICYNKKGYDESEFIDAVTEKTQIKNLKVFPIDKEILDNGLWRKMIYHQDMPLPSLSHFSEYKVFETAKANNFKVVLDGQGSDEYLAGYHSFFSPLLVDDLFTLQWFSLFKQLVFLRKTGKKKIVKGLFDYLFFNRIKRLIKLMLKRNEIKQAGILAPEILAANSSIKFNGTELLSFSKKQINSVSIPYQLHSEDRNSMMNSVESRIPFLNHNLLEFVLSLPNGYKISKDRTKFVLREALKNELPEKIYNRTDKMGFVAPEEHWFFENYSTLKKEIEYLIKTFPKYFTNDLLNDLEKSYASKNYKNVFFRLYTFSIWQKEFNVSM